MKFIENIYSLLDIFVINVQSKGRSVVQKKENSFLKFVIYETLLYISSTHHWPHKNVINANVIFIDVIFKHHQKVQIICIYL